MTPAELKAARHALGLSAEGFARLVRVQSGRTVRRWEAGDAPIPGAVDVILIMYEALHGIAFVNPHPEPGQCVYFVEDERGLERRARAALAAITEDRE
jgi:transcriptional regulator with XRE-family HTH domain